MNYSGVPIHAGAIKRAIVIGCPGAGKSNFARTLRERTGLPLYYLDQIWHKADGSNVSSAEFDAHLARILQQERWIIDGNYLRTLELRLSQCDTVFLLDYPTAVCLDGAEQRIGTPREDLPWVEEVFDPEFRQWIEDFPTTQLPQIYQLLDRYRTGREIFVFRSREEGNAWLKTFCRDGDMI